jgi:hypothetical protein
MKNIIDIRNVLGEDVGADLITDDSIGGVAPLSSIDGLGDLSINGAANGASNVSGVSSGNGGGPVVASTNNGGSNVVY